MNVNAVLNDNLVQEVEQLKRDLKHEKDRNEHLVIMLEATQRLLKKRENKIKELLEKR